MSCCLAASRSVRRLSITLSALDVHLYPLEIGTNRRRLSFNAVTVGTSAGNPMSRLGIDGIPLRRRKARSN